MWDLPDLHSLPLRLPEESIVSNPSSVISPVSQLTASMQILNSIPYGQTPRRRLSLGSCTPSPLVYLASAHQSPSPAAVSGEDAELSDKESDSPFLYGRETSTGGVSRTRCHAWSPKKRRDSASAVTAAGYRDSLDSVPEEIDGDLVTEIALCDVNILCGKKAGSALYDGRGGRVLHDETNVLDRCWPCKRSLVTSLTGAAQATRDILLDKENTPYTHSLILNSADTNSQKHCEVSAKFSAVCSQSIDTLLSSPILAECHWQNATRVKDISSDCDKPNEHQEDVCKSLPRAVAVQSIPRSDSVSHVGERNVSCLNTMKVSSQCDNDDDSSFAASSERKRRCKTVGSRSDVWAPLSTTCTFTAPASTLLQHVIARCPATNEVIIKSALNQADNQLQDLVGDFTGPYCLPTVRSAKHQDLKAISCDTLSSILRNEYDDVIQKYVIVDCRYPYEYTGGHIQDSLNTYTKEDIVTQFIKSDEFHKCAVGVGKRLILVFHCEFSSERGPRLMHFLRNKDREVHRDCYPALYYPEMYLLEGGYKAFFESHSDQCIPNCYKPMVHDDHLEDLRHFRAKAKSWAGERHPQHDSGLTLVWRDQMMQKAS